MIITGGQIRQAVSDLLHAQLPAVLAALATPDLLLPDIVTWSRLPDFTVIAENQSPACIITTPGPSTIEQPMPGRAPVSHWDVRVFFVVRGRTFEETADRVAAYTAACRSVLLAAERLEGLSAGVMWTAERYTELPSASDRTIGAGSVTVTYTGVETNVTP